jgi:Kef-type K+ transport system membrane component KefB
VTTGLQINLVDLSVGLWGWSLLILAAAVAGKWGGTAGAARLAGGDWRWAATVGTLMNCRGVTELVVLGIGQQIGIITPQLYAVLVLVAIVTTAVTAPLLSRLTRDNLRLASQRLPQDLVSATSSTAVREAAERPVR